MTDEEIRRSALDVLGNIAPEADLTTLDHSADLQEVLDMDSYDFLAFVVGLDEKLGVEIPERDYQQLATLDACVAYVGARLADRIA
jgi:acyl carrier protein